MSQAANTIAFPNPGRLSVRELSVAEIESMYPMIAKLNPNMQAATFRNRLAEMLPLGYRAIGAFEGAVMVGLCGFWVRTRFWCGKQLDVDNLVVNPEIRGRGIGEMLMQWIEERALAEGCELIVLDAYIDSFLAHRFYHRLGYTTTGFHFTKIPGSNMPYTRK